MNKKPVICDEEKLMILAAMSEYLRILRKEFPDSPVLKRYDSSYQDSEARPPMERGKMKGLDFLCKLISVLILGWIILIVWGWALVALASAP